MDMSNYPPGVTGRELAIAGPDWEGSLDVTCDNDEAQLLAVTVSIANLLTDLQNASPDEQAMIGKRLRRLLTQQPVVEVDDAVCPFSGTVEAWSYRRVLRWECPMCGLHHEEDQAEEDPDEARDRLLDERSEWEWRHGQEE